MRSIYFFMALVTSLNCHAQKQNNNWVFGTNCGVTFNTSPASSFNSSNHSDEGVASVSNRNTGALLFFSAENDLRNSINNLMPNGINIGGNIASSIQAVNIVPFLNDTNRYYVFTVTSNGAGGILSYSIVDMSLDGGLGDVVPGQKGVVIGNSFSEAMTVTEGCSGYWLMAFNDVTNAFHAYQITAAGINTTPVISLVSYPKTYNSQKAMKISPNRARLGVVSFTDFVYMHDFDPTTGKVINGVIIDTSNAGYTGGQKVNAGFYGCEFSPDSRLFYVSAYNLSALYLYDVTQSTAAAIMSSRKTVHAPVANFGGSLQLAPDGNIYLSRHMVKSLGKISSPNAGFPNFKYTDSAFALAVNSQTIFGLPQRVVRPQSGNAFVATHNLTACLDKPLVLHAIGKGAYEWQNGSILDSFLATTEGTYWVRITGPCTTFIDTFIVRKSKIDTATTRRDTIMCKNGALTLNAANASPGASHKWSNGSTANHIKVSSAGTFWVNTIDACTYATDTIAVTEVQVTADVKVPDTTICYGDTLILAANVNPAQAAIKWSNGDTILSSKASTVGRYILSAEFLGCKATDHVDITHFPRIFIELGSDTAICAHEPLLLPRLATSEQNDKYLWQDGSSSRSHNVTKTGRYTVHITNQCGTTSDTIDVTARNCRLYFPDAFSPNGDGRNDFAHLLGDIENVNNYELHIFHRWGQKVYTGNDVNTGWDGTHNGQPAAQATYYYYIKFRYLGKDEMMKGSLILLR